MPVSKSKRKTTSQKNIPTVIQKRVPRHKQLLASSFIHQQWWSPLKRLWGDLYLFGECRHVGDEPVEKILESDEEIHACSIILTGYDFIRIAYSRRREKIDLSSLEIAHQCLERKELIPFEVVKDGWDVINRAEDVILKLPMLEALSISLSIFILREYQKIDGLYEHT